MSSDYFPLAHRTKTSLNPLYHNLITASHILDSHSLLSASSLGHISIRNPDSTDTFFLPNETIPPNLLSTADDILEYRYEDSTLLSSSNNPSSEDSNPSLSERYISSEIYKRFPGVNCIIHSHHPSLLPFCTAKAPLKPLIPEAGFLGTEAPAWDITSAYSSGIFSSNKQQEHHDHFVRTRELGAAFAIKFSKTSTSSGFIYSKLSESVGSLTGGKDKDGHAGQEMPDWPVLLMRNHGFTVVAGSVEEAVYMAVMMVRNAEVMAGAVGLNDAWFAKGVEGSTQKEGGAIKGGKVVGKEEVQVLSGREARDAWESLKEGGVVQRAWRGWAGSVERKAEYRNEVERE
ncbi:MAG: hypothetical protein M1820_008460 [Bogoriella megaspora]|nr:MAG: hypothetical protein M1820_008460 [Bogoriella megaspora]